MIESSPLPHNFKYYSLVNVNKDNIDYNCLCMSLLDSNIHIIGSRREKKRALKSSKKLFLKNSSINHELCDRFPESLQVMSDTVGTKGDITQYFMSVADLYISPAIF